jgi:methionyl aminopeptidase
VSIKTLIISVKVLKNINELNGMREAGKLAAEVLEMITDHVKPGISTGKLDEICHDFIIEEQKAIPANIGYRGFEKTLCTSINQVICHGIPDNERILKNGDIMNIDVTVIKDGWHGDTSKMFLVGKVQPHNKRLVQITQECLYKGIEAVRPGAKLGDIGHAIQVHAEKNHYSVVEEYCGHGIGSIYHDEPQILHYGSANTGQEIIEGMCFTIEPMINIGSKSTKVLSDDWTVETKDGRNSAQWEHTIYVNKDGAEILTLRSEES